MLNWFNSPRLPRFRMSSRITRVIFGMMFIYVGINLAGAWIQNDSNANAGIISMVHKYDAAEITESVVSDVGNALADSFDKNGQPTTITGANNQAKEVSASLEGRFREKIPAVQNAFTEIIQSIITPFQEALRQGASKHN